PLFDWVKQRKLSTADLALARVDHTRGVYAVYHDISGQWAMGISSGANANDVNLSSIPKEAECLAYLSFNQDGYSVYCRNYREYWQWVEARNDARYESTLGHGQGYDAKNMMHTIRLLEMAIEIYRDERLNVHRPNRAFLLDVKAGKYSLAEVLEMAKDRLEQLAFLVDKSKLPDQVSKAFVNQQLVRLREQLY
ncbi:MAG: nucleotidyltransferase, partial [Bacteroidota bacterium]